MGTAIGLMVSYGLIVIGGVLLVAALRLRGCVAFLAWLVVGMAIGWYVLHVLIRYPFPFSL